MCCLCAAPAAAHPLNENILRYEVQVFILTSGLRLDVHLLTGGLVTTETWAASEVDGDGVLSATEQAAWSSAILVGLQLQVAGQPVPLRADRASYPDRENFLSCAQPIALACEAALDVPRQKWVTITAAVRPDTDLPVLAKVLFVAPASVEVQADESRGGRGTARVRWPAEGTPPDTRDPRVTSPSWFYELPGDLPFDARVPGPELAKTDLAPLDAQPTRAAAPNRSPGIWFVMVGLAAGWLALRRRGLGQR